MSKPIERRADVRNKHARTHSWDAHPEFESMMVEFGCQHVADDAPIPSNDFPTSGKVPYPAHGRPDTTTDKYTYDTGE